MSKYPDFLPLYELMFKLGGLVESVDDPIINASNVFDYKEVPDEKYN